MSLVDHIDGKRRIWNYPRPIRTSTPALYRGIIQLIFSDSKYSNLTDRDDQYEFDQHLQRLLLKRQTAKPRDRNPGTVRTIINHLENLYLIFRDPLTKKIYTTLCGDKLLNDEDISEVMRKVILANQYPSGAGFKRNVWMNPNIKVKPNAFILKLLLDDEIRTLRAKEIFIPIIYGHNNKCFDLCKNKILKMRKGKNWYELIDNITQDLYTPRIGPCKGTENEINNWEQYLHDIATTIIPLLNDVGLVQDDYDQDGRYISLNPRYINEIVDAVNMIDVIQPYSLETYESFQRKLGAFGKRDNRNLKTLENAYGKKKAKEILMKNHFLLKARKQIIEDLSEKLIEEYAENFSEDKNVVRRHLQSVVEKAYSAFEDNLILCSESGKRKALEFEKLLAELFRRKFGFAVIQTGQLNRRAGGHNFGDLYIVDSGKTQSIISDAKAISDYALPIGDKVKMHSYIRSHKELNDKYYANKEIRLILGLFIARTLSSSFDNNAKNFHKKIGDVHISGIEIKELITLSKIRGIKERQNEFVNSLKISGQINSLIFD